MATVVLQVVGAAIGGAIGGPVGAAIGRAAGAAAGYAIDQKLFTKDQLIKGGRLEDSRFLSSNEGVPIPRAYGRVKLGGQIIWATRFEEVRSVSKRGGKGGPSVKSENYSYYANFAVGICEGPVSLLGRVWADGKEIDQTKFNMRFYNGSEEQDPDPLIEAKQGFNHTPAFKGTAYVVFEDFPLASYGNRIPQISFEIVRSLAKVDSQIRSVTLIPGATEFGYSPVEIYSNNRGHFVSENRQTLVAGSNWQASLDELQALCPQLTTVSLVVPWFGDDLRAGNCLIEPRVSHKDLTRSNWSVNGIDRSAANEISKIAGKPAYGGTPDDATIIAAITDLKARGLKVVFYPFLMMDIPADNQLPDPYGQSNQPAYPWRGRITCDSAIGTSGTVDQTANAKTQIETLLGTAGLGDFQISGNNISFIGTPEWSLRRMILHYANLVELAGGVECFLIGSELRGLTRVRDENDEFPFVGGLVALADDVRQIVSANTKLSYAADWSEYFGYHPGNASNDVYFNLDKLWSSPAIDAVAIDNYMPLSDWHEDGDPDFSSIQSKHDTQMLKANILGGEGYDWFYQNDSDRAGNNRTPITDGQNEPWIWAYKDIPAWWTNLHYERKNGIRSSTPTNWTPQSKPIWFSELGCPAIDRGSNQPNVFIDAKSDENSAPYFSNYGRDDLIQLRYIQSQLDFWETNNSLVEPHNPVSNLYQGPMISLENMAFWTWDARPYPQFPFDLKQWSDGQNWYRGHWLNGRLGSCPVDDLIIQIFKDYGFEVPLCKIDGHMEGYIIAGEASVRSAIEPLLLLHNISVGNEGDKITFKGKQYLETISVSKDDFVQQDDNPKITHARESEIELPKQIDLSHSDISSDFDTITSSSRRLETTSKRQMQIELSSVLPQSQAIMLCDARLKDFWATQDSATIQLSNRNLHIEPGDIIKFDDARSYQIRTITHGTEMTLEMSGISQFDESSKWSVPQNSLSNFFGSKGQPLVLLMNLPVAQGEADPSPRIYCAGTSTPWRGPLAVYMSPGTSGFELITTVKEPSAIFELDQQLTPGPFGRWDYENDLIVQMLDDNGEFQSVEKELLFAGSNGVAVNTVDDGWEIIQFLQAELLETGKWKLSTLLRGQLGTELESISGALAGAFGVILDGSIKPIQIPSNLTNTPLNWKIGPAGEDLGSPAMMDNIKSCSRINTRPLRPVHLRQMQTNDDFFFTWIRQSRIDGDNWQIENPPLDAAKELYAINIKSSQGHIVRTFEADETQFSYSASDRLNDLNDLNAPFSLEVSQILPTGVAGPANKLKIEF